MPSWDRSAKWYQNPVTGTLDQGMRDEDGWHYQLDPSDPEAAIHFIDDSTPDGQGQINQRLMQLLGYNPNDRQLNQNGSREVQIMNPNTHQYETGVGTLNGDEMPIGLARDRNENILSYLRDPEDAHGGALGGIGDMWDEGAFSVPLMAAAPWLGGQIGGALGIGSTGGSAVLGGVRSAISGGNPILGAVTSGAGSAFGDYMRADGNYGPDGMGNDLTGAADTPGVEVTPYRDVGMPTQSELPNTNIPSTFDTEGASGTGFVPPNNDAFDDLGENDLRDPTFDDVTVNRYQPVQDPVGKNLSAHPWLDKITKDPLALMKLAGGAATLLGVGGSKPANAYAPTAAASSGSTFPSIPYANVSSDPRFANFNADYMHYGVAGSPQANEHRFYAQGGMAEAMGGMGMDDGMMEGDDGMSDNLFQGAGGGRDDLVQANVSPNEYIFDADTVADLGDGNPEEGARRLDEMRERIRMHRRGRRTMAPDAKRPEQYLGRI